MPTINALNVYVPAEDYELSQRFYTALGFTLTGGFGGSKDCVLGGAKFRLQNYYNKDWAENFMMIFDVPDVKEWYAFAKKVIDTGEFANARISEPEMVGDTGLVHIWDPCGVLLILLD
jgi:hypothetical protein